MYSTNSPSQAKRALEAHLKDTDRRIQDASRLGTTLLQQRKDLSARLKDVEQVQQDYEVPADLRKKLAELEKEYNEVGKESARAFLPKPRAPLESVDGNGTPAVLSGLARESPTKVSAPSRRQRNQPSNRVHDIEFATEISTSLLAQVRQLQAALAEKDEALKDTTSEKAQLEAEAASMVQRIKHMDEVEHRYKDENWNLETKLQELETVQRETVDKHDRINQTLKLTQSEKAAAQRDLDDLRVSHDKLSEEHSFATKQQETDMHGLRRDVASHQTEKQTLQKKIDELTSQNTELAKAVSYRWNQSNAVSDRDFASVNEDVDEDDSFHEQSEPASPVKGTPRHGMLESETLKSSLNHAHRMIQNLKNNIHREKTEKMELKRMLQDTRDELESKRGDGAGAAAAAKKRKSEPDGIKFKKPARPLGANRSSTTEVLEDEPDWEDHDGQHTPSKFRGIAAAGGAVAGGAGIATFDHAAFAGAEEPETTDAFETANERDATETEAFETGNERMSADEGELTETEGGLNRSGTVRAVSGVSTLVGAKARDRRSFESTASTSADEAEEVRTPVQTSQQPKYRLRLNRSSKQRLGRVGDLATDSPRNASPSSSQGTPQPAGQSLGDELDALDEGTPVSQGSEDVGATPETQRDGFVEAETPSKAPLEEDEKCVEEEHEPEISSPIASPLQPKPEGEQAVLAHQANAAMLAHEFAIQKPEMVDAGVMTEPWKPEREIVYKTPQSKSPQHQTMRDRAGEVVGGALAGFGLGRLRSNKPTGEAEEVQPGAESIDETPARELAMPAATPMNEGGVSGPTSQDLADEQLSVPVVDEPKSLRASVIEPLEAAKHADTVPLAAAPVFSHSAIVSQQTEPISPPRQLFAETQPQPFETNSGKGLERTTDAGSKAEGPLVAAAPFATRAAPQRLPDFGFSGIEAQTLEPSALAEEAPPHTPFVPKRSSRRLDTLFADEDDETIPGTEGSRPGAGFFAAGIPLSLPPPLARSRSKSAPGGNRKFETNEDGSGRSVIEPKVYGGIVGSSGIPTLQFGDDDDDDMVPTSTVPRGPMTPNARDGETSMSQESVIPITKPLQIKKPMVDGGAQTMMSGDEIDNMLRNKSRTSSMATSVTDVGVSPIRPQRRSIDGMVATEALSMRAPRRPASAGNIRNQKPVKMAPPLPEDHTLKIAAAAQKAPGTATVGTMGPPTMPASAYKQARPRTPAERAHSMSRDGTTPRPRHRDSRQQIGSPGNISRRTSVSSFASELDERFNITRGNVIYPSDIEPATDPRMIQAITQTMIGEYLWKYTRKAGRSETSTTRHRRFFWVHPYTRTLYWSEKDPSTAGRDMLKAKSVAIEAVRVITDDNTYPPGLHRKSIVVVTPGREIVFTAPTGQRHETWFNALSYLLLKSEKEREEAEDTFDQADVDEFNPGFSIRRSISRMTGRDRSESRQSRQSLSSYNSRTTRTSSPQKREGGSLAQRQSAAVAAETTTATPTLAPKAAAGTATSRTSTMHSNAGSVSGRLSSITSRFRPSSSQRGSFSSKRGRSSVSLRGRHTGENGEIYDASVVGESAEDLRAVIERQESEADRLENVRACCDGKCNE